MRRFRHRDVVATLCVVGGIALLLGVVAATYAAPAQAGRPSVVSYQAHLNAAREGLDECAWGITISAMACRTRVAMHNWCQEQDHAGSIAGVPTVFSQCVAWGITPNDPSRACKVTTVEPLPPNVAGPPRPVAGPCQGRMAYRLIWPPFWNDPCWRFGDQLPYTYVVRRAVLFEITRPASGPSVLRTKLLPHRRDQCITEG